MAIVFAYTEATNIVVVTGGTSGTPATFADFVTADRAGTAELKAATNCAKDMTLTYAIRPVEFRALQISFVIAAKTAETDYLWITGTDAWGTALYECIDISAGNGTYVSTQYFATITDIDVEDVGDGSGTAAADGTLQVTQPQWGVIWDYGEGIYKVDSKLEIGNGSTSTYFASESESVSFTAGIIAWRCPYNIKAAATCRIGKQVNSEPQKGSMWIADDCDEFSEMTINETSATAIIEVYGSVLSYGGTCAAHKGFRGPITIQDSMLYTTAAYNWQFHHATTDLDNVFINNGNLQFRADISALDRVHHDLGVWAGIVNYSAGDITVIKPEVTNQVNADHTYRTELAGGLVVRDPSLLPIQATVKNDNAAGVTYLEFTVDIHVTDKDGTDLQNVSVLCEDSIGGGSVVGGFSAKLTDASGDITTQYIYRQKWVGISEDETDYSPHKFTLSKAGYETLILNNITVDAHIVWHLELQPMRARVLGRPSRRISAPNFQ